MPDLSRRQVNLLLQAGLAIMAASARAAGPGGGKPGLDHFVWAVPNLEQGRELFHRLTGVLPVVGGITPGRSEPHNALASLGNGTYIEVFAPHVAMKSGPWLDLVQDGKPHLAGFGLHVDDGFSRVRSGLERAGLHPSAPRALSRERPDGVNMKFEVLLVEGRKFGEVLPFFIDWMDTRPHPSEDSPGGASLSRFEVRHPEASELRRIFALLDIDVSVIEALRPSLAIEMQTGNGTVLLES